MNKVKTKKLPTTYEYTSNMAEYKIEEDADGVCTIYRNNLLIDWYSKKDAEAKVKAMVKDDNRRKPK
jgi:hypothetical protein